MPSQAPTQNPWKRSVTAPRIDLKKIFGRRVIAFQPCFVDLTGSVTAALMLSQACYWSERTADPEGWFWKSREQWQEETRLTRYEQESARRVLRKFSFWQEKTRRWEHKIFYRVDFDALEQRFSALPKAEKPPSDEGRKTSFGKGEKSPS